MPCYIAPKNVELFARHKVYSGTELHARYEIKLDSYCKVVRIEALTMLDMLWKDILPAISAFTGELAASANAKRAMLPVDVSYESATIQKLCDLAASATIHGRALEKAMDGVRSQPDTLSAARYYCGRVLPAMESLRAVVDEAETRCASRHWPYPSYGEILGSVN